MKVPRAATRWAPLAAVVTLVLAACCAEPPPSPDELPYDELLQQLEQPDKAVWTSTVEALGARGPAYVPDLVGALTDDHRAVREGAAHVLGDLGPDAEPAVHALAARVPLEDDDFVRWKLIRALGAIGPGARAALPVLRPIADDPRETEIIHASAQKAVKDIEAR